MRDELLSQLEEWHEEDHFEQIVNCIRDIPVADRDYELVNHLGRALNNLERYEEAVEQFLSVADAGQVDPLWHYRTGFAYYYLERYEQALHAFEAAERLEPGDEEIGEFLELIRDKLLSQSVEVEEETQPVSVAKAVTERGTALDFASSDFWEDSEQALEQYVMNPPTDELIASVEEELVFRLPTFYVQMMKQHNGGISRYRSFPVGDSVSAVQRHIVISGIFGIGREKPYSLCGAAGNRCHMEREGYPEFGVVICDCPAESGVIMLDYRESGNDGEPEVVHVDQANHTVTRLAPDFATFIRGLVQG